MLSSPTISEDYVGSIVAEVEPSDKKPCFCLVIHISRVTVRNRRVIESIPEKNNAYTEIHRDFLNIYVDQMVGVSTTNWRLFVLVMATVM